MQTDITSVRDYCFPVPALSCSATADRRLELPARRLIHRRHPRQEMRNGMLLTVALLLPFAWALQEVMATMACG